MCFLVEGSTAWPITVSVTGEIARISGLPLSGYE